MITTADTHRHRVSHWFQSSQTAIAGASRRSFSVAEAQRARHVDVDPHTGHVDTSRCHGSAPLDGRAQMLDGGAGLHVVDGFIGRRELISAPHPGIARDSRMARVEAVAGHYSSGTLWDRLVAALAADGIDPSGPSVIDLAPFDQFHGRGLEGTREMADGMAATPDDRLLDVGSGLGGPARYLADRFGCHVTGIDVTAEFCDVADRLNAATGLQGRVDIHHASALDMPFDDDTFDGAVSMNVSMNIADRDALYREIRRVLRPGGWLMLSELAQGPNTEPLEFPTPWAGTAAESFLTTPDRTVELLEANGFSVDVCTDKSDEHLAYRRRTRALIDQGRPSPARAVGLVHPESAAEAAVNTGAGVAAGQLVPIEIRCVRVG